VLPYRNIHKHTWTSPDGKIHNQIDHILTDKRQLSDIFQVRSLRGADCHTDHYLVLAIVREQLSVIRVAQKFDMGRFKSHKLNDGKSKISIRLKSK
jgi:hypothetical protein